MDRLTSGTDPNCECSRCTAECVNEWDGLCWVRLAIKRLAAYEDTGLTPDEIAALRAENAAFKADIEAGRVVRIPIKVGEKVYCVRGDRKCDRCSHDPWHCFHDPNAKCPPPQYVIVIETVDGYEYNGDPLTIQDAGSWGCERLETFYSLADGPFATPEEAEAARAALGAQEGAKP
jgi:hypothetical protein